MTDQPTKTTTGRPKPIVRVLREVDHGQALRDAARQLHKVLAAVEDTGKAGKVTLTVTVTPPKHGDHLLIEAEAKASVPRRTPTASVFFVDGEGNATRHDPNQLALIGGKDPDYGDDD